MKAIVLGLPIFLSKKPHHLPYKAILNSTTCSVKFSFLSLLGNSIISEPNIQHYFSKNHGLSHLTIFPTLMKLKEPFWLLGRSHCSVINLAHVGEPFVAPRSSSLCLEWLPWLPMTTAGATNGSPGSPKSSLICL